MEKGHSIAIVTDADAASVSAIYVSVISGEIIATSEKAIKVSATSPRGKEISAWFPRKAIQISKTHDDAHGPHHEARLAPWFRPNGWTATFIDLTSNA